MARYKSVIQRRVEREAKKQNKIFNGVVYGVQEKGVRTYTVQLIEVHKKPFIYNVKTSLQVDLYKGDGCIVQFMGKSKTLPYITGISYQGTSSQDGGARKETGKFDVSSFDECVFG